MVLRCLSPYVKVLNKPFLNQAKCLLLISSLTDNKGMTMKQLALIACAAVVFLAGCNTVKGVGRDISSGGQAVTGAAHNVQHNM